MSTFLHYLDAENTEDQRTMAIFLKNRYQGFINDVQYGFNVHMCIIYT